MWVMTSFGILMPAIRPPKTVDPGDERTLQVRTRREKELDILRARYMPTTLGATIATPQMDYEYRAYCSPHAWALALANMSIDLVDYTKFKPSTEDKFGDTDLHRCYDAVWAVVMSHLGSPITYKYTAGGWKGYPGTNGYVGGLYAGGRDRSEWGGGTGHYALESGTGWGKHRNTAADRDTYNPEVDGDPWAASRTADRIVIDDLYDEMDYLLSQQRDNWRIDHSACDHGGSAAAKARCRRRTRTDNSTRIEEIRIILNESYADATEHLDAEAALTAEAAMAGGEVVGEVVE